MLSCIKQDFEKERTATDEIKRHRKEDEGAEGERKWQQIPTKRGRKSSRETPTDQSPLRKIRLTCKQLALHYNKELILRPRAACDWLKYHSSIPGWRETDFIGDDRDTEKERGRVCVSMTTGEDSAFSVQCCSSPESLIL